MQNKPLYISDETLAGWQNVVDLMAKIVCVPSGLVMKLTGEDIEVLVASRTEENPYKPGERERLLDSGLYCERVVQSRDKLRVPDALADPEWENNPDVKLNMIAYLGFPLLFPDGSPFGTICVLDNKPNHFPSIYEEFINGMQAIIQNELAILYVNKELGDENKRLIEYVDEIKALRQLIPICAHCKKIRDDDGYWEGVESYLGKHLGTSFTHGICPECLAKHFPDIAATLKEEK